MNIQLLEAAQQELDEAIEWYANQAPGLGEALLIEKNLQTDNPVSACMASSHGTDAAGSAESFSL